MTKFEEVTKTPETLGAFLKSLPILQGPWDDEFQKAFCSGCHRNNCDHCKHEEERSDPTWWLMLNNG